MTSNNDTRSYLLPLAVAAGTLALWWLLSVIGVFPESLFPSPAAVGNLNAIAISPTAHPVRTQ